MWEAYAFRYATQPRQARENFVQLPDPHDGPMPLDYFIWVLRRESRVIVVDTGFSAETAARRGRVLLRPVAEALAALAVDPSAVEDVIVTHLHYDHAGNLDLFPNARFHLQEREMGFATGAPMCCRFLRQPFEVEDVVRMVRALYAERVVFHQGPGEVAAGVRVHHVGGHTDGLQMVEVETADGPLVLASDALHFYANMERGIPYPIVYDVGAMAQGWEKARRLARGEMRRIVAGHDPLVLRRFPSLPGLSGEAVALHLGLSGRGLTEGVV
jgi:glyoxylase-like metal-dependent hydrolase (beta-lactamase superfamily II)